MDILLLKFAFPFLVQIDIIGRMRAQYPLHFHESILLVFVIHHHMEDTNKVYRNLGLLTKQGRLIIKYLLRVIYLDQYCIDYFFD
jgi:hypothetical protein